MPPPGRFMLPEGTSAAVDTDQAFIRLCLVYTWLAPAVRGPRNIVANAEKAPSAFRRTWHELLPDERERAVDILVSRFADLEAGVAGEWDMIGYNAVRKACKRSSRPRDTRASAVRLYQLETTIDAIAQAVSPGDVEEVARLKAIFFGIEGFTAGKLQRMEIVEWNYCSNGLNEGLERIQRAVPISQALLPVNVLLAHAHVLAQTPAERFAIFTRCVDDLLKVYQLHHLPNETPEQHLEYLRDARDTLLSDVEATSFVQHLHPDQQLAAVRLARERLFHSCHALMSSDSLPNLKAIVNDLCMTVMVTVYPSPHSASTQHHLPSLARPDQHLARSLGASSRSPFFPVPRRSAW